MKCATVRGEQEVYPWLDHRVQDAPAGQFSLGEKWWWSRSSSIKIDQQLVTPLGRILEASLAMRGRDAELVRPFKKEKHKQIIVHFKLAPLPDGGVRYTARLKKGQKLAERQLFIRETNAKYSLHEMLVTMGPGDRVTATRTGKLWGEPEQLSISCSEVHGELRITKG